nr:YgiQ family radical SAM protein [Burkholderiaceae bacterium]
MAAVTTAPVAMPVARPLTGWRPYWAKRFGTAPFLPMSRAEMDALGWDACDVIVVTGDAYVDHPSFGMAVIGRTLEAQGFRVGIIAQPDWHSADPFKGLGRPTLFFGVTAGNMDSMINRYTADRKVRSDDAYTPGDVGGKRPDRASLVYAQRCREAYPDVPIVLGGIEASLRRIAHYEHITDVRGTAFMRRPDDPALAGWFEIDSTQVDTPGKVDALVNPYMTTEETAAERGGACAVPESTPAADGARPITIVRRHLEKTAGRAITTPRERTVIRLPSYEQVKSDAVLYAHANRVLHLETNPGNARALVQR